MSPKSPKPPGARPRGRRPGPSTTREQILRAARDAFATSSFQHATIRAIAADAGVDAALVMQFFGNKQQLFAAAMELPFDPEQATARMIDGPKREIGVRMVRVFLELWDDPEVGPRMLGLMRSAASHAEAAARLRELLEGQLLRPVTSSLEADEPQVRGQMAASQLAGLGFTRYLLRLEPLASAPSEVVVGWAGPTLQRYLTGPVD